MILDRIGTLSQKASRVGFLVTLLGALCLNTTLAFAKPIRSGHVEIELIPSRSFVAPNDTLEIAIRYDIDPEWHLYWTNPGDAGLAPTVNWKLPEGFTAGKLKYPIPKRILAGPLVSFGYAGECILLADITAPANLKSDQKITIAADLDWLVCKSECIPGDAQLSTSIQTSNAQKGTSETNSALFARAKSLLPVRSSSVSVDGVDDGKTIKLHFTGVPFDTASKATVFFYPSRKGVIENASPQQLTLTGGKMTLQLFRSNMFLDTLKSMPGILVVETHDGATPSVAGYQVDAVIKTSLPATTQVAATSTTSLFEALLFAFVGGLILNLMPCVLPVLSLKILGFVQQRGESKSTILTHNAFYTIGVLVAFLTLASFLVLLRAGGDGLGWGFQLQSPPIVAVLACFMFLVALNILGVFEVGTSLTGIGGHNRRAGYTGSFISGVTATVVATPCTAPFMGAALGFALTQPTAVTLGIFTSLGFGMAAPFVILTSIPQLRRFIPKPGRWMETLKQALGFLLMASVIWLVWVFGTQTSVDGILILLLALLVAGICGWAYGRWGNLSVATGKRIATRSIVIVLVLVVVTTVAVMSSSLPTSQSSGATTSGTLTWEPFSEQRVDQLRGEGKPILIDFTAAWCLSCKVNERVAFSSTEVQQRLKNLGVVTMKADWTAKDQNISDALARFGRNSVPLYVLYSGVRNSEPILLPELLTPGIVLKALDSI